MRVRLPALLARVQVRALVNLVQVYLVLATQNVMMMVTATQNVMTLWTQRLMQSLLQVLVNLVLVLVYLVMLRTQRQP